MAGVKGRSGRKRKPTRQQKADGGYRADRHGDRIDDSIQLNGIAKPATLTKMQGELWDAVVGTLPAGVLGNIDAPALIGLVRWYELYHRLMTNAEKSPLDGEMAKQAAMAWDRFWRAAAEFGIGPCNRARLTKPDLTKEPESPFAAILNRKASAN